MRPTNHAESTESLFAKTLAPGCGAMPERFASELLDRIADDLATLGLALESEQVTMPPDMLAMVLHTIGERARGGAALSRRLLEHGGGEDAPAIAGR